MTRTHNKILKLVILLAVALLSMLVISRFAASPESHAHTIASLDEKKETVMELTAASTAASAAITLIPGDVGTPIADKLADMSSYFLIVLCAIYLEKYLLTIIGYATFVILIPLACLLLAIGLFRWHELMRRSAVKLALFGIVLFLVIPVSVKIADMIEETYQISIESTLENAKQMTEEISEEAEEEDEGILSGLISTVQNGVTGITEKIETSLNNFIEALAVMLVTSCVIPILVMVFFVWIIKMAFGMNGNENAGVRRKA